MMSNFAGSWECSFDLPNTPENNKAIEALMKQCKEAEEKEIERVKKILCDACAEEAKKWSVGDPLVDDSCRNPITKVLIAGAIIGWNKCSEYHSDMLEHELNNNKE